MPSGGAMGTPPNILLLTTGCLSFAHGTGARLLQHFASYPRQHLWNIFCGLQGEPELDQHLWVTIHGDWRASLRRWRRRLFGIPTAVDMRTIRQYLTRRKWHPDLIYATCLHRDDLIVLDAILQQYDYALPVIQHFLDWHPDDSEAIHLLQKLNPYLSEVWALTENIQLDISHILGRPTSLVSVFHCDLPTIYKQHHHPYSSNFRAVILGNCSYTEIFDDLAYAWQQLETDFPDLQPIHWYGHPNAINSLFQRGYKLPPAIEYRGFIANEELIAKLVTYDLALIPFNRADQPESYYARYSCPSRITELASAGLPLCLLAGSETAAAQYIWQNDIGVVVNPSHREQLIAELKALLQDSALRQTLGHKSRCFAEAHFDVVKHRQFLYATFNRLLQQPTEIAPAYATTPLMSNQNRLALQKPYPPPAGKTSPMPDDSAPP